VVVAQWASVKRLASERIEGATYTDEREVALPLSEDDRKTINPLAFGIPSLEVFYLTSRTKRFPKGSDGHLFFTPIIPKDGEELMKFQRVMWEEFHSAEIAPRIGHFTTPNTWLYHAFACVVIFLTSRSDVEHNQKMRKFYRRLIKVAASHGWGDYRASPIFQDDVMDTYSFNDHALLRFIEQLKDAADPNGIIAPGRSGIWPKAMRD